MAINRRDDTVQDAQGNALSGASVYYLTQPANTSIFPPTPLAVVYTNTSGTVGTQPVITDGFGHATIYLNSSVMYTVAYYHPLFGASPQIYTDQVIPGIGGGGGNTVTAVNASTAASTITGSIPGTVFTLPSTPAAGSLVLAQQGILLTAGVGYSITGAVITLSQGLDTGDGLNANYLLIS